MTPAIVDISKLSRADLVDQLELWGHGTDCFTGAPGGWQDAYSDQALRKALDHIQLIARLEDFGIDCAPGVPVNWREAWTVRRLRAELSSVTNATLPNEAADAC